MKLHVLGINLGKTVFHLVGLDGGPEPQIPSITASASSRTFSSTPLILRAGSGVQGGPTVFVGPFIARPLTLRTARYNRSPDEAKLRPYPDSLRPLTKTPL